MVCLDSHLQPSTQSNVVVASMETKPLITSPVKRMGPNVALTGPPVQGKSSMPVLPVCTESTKQLGMDFSMSPTTSVGVHPPTSQSASTMPSQSSSLPLH